VRATLTKGLRRWRQFLVENPLNPDDTLIELGLNDSQVRPVLGRRLRELDAVP
jgi:hypothetical protein